MPPTILLAMLALWVALRCMEALAGAMEREGDGQVGDQVKLDGAQSSLRLVQDALTLDGE